MSPASAPSPPSFSLEREDADAASDKLEALAGGRSFREVLEDEQESRNRVHELEARLAAVEEHCFGCRGVHGKEGDPCPGTGTGGGG